MATARKSNVVAQFQKITVFYIYIVTSPLTALHAPTYLFSSKKYIMIHTYPLIPHKYMYTMYTFSINCVYIYMYIIVYTLSHTYTTNIQMPLQSWWPSLDCQDHLATMHATQFPILFLPWGNHFPAVAEYILWWPWHSLGVRGSNSSWLRTPRLRPIYVMRKNMKKHEMKKPHVCEENEKVSYL